MVNLPARYIGVFNAGAQTPQRKASLSSIVSPITLLGCPKCALLNPTQAPPKAKATRSKGSLASVAIQSFCPVPYTRRRATPPSESTRRLRYFLVGKAAACGPRTANALRTTPAAPGPLSSLSLVLEQLFELSKGRLVVLRSQPRCHGLGKAFRPGARRLCFPAPPPAPASPPGLRRSPLRHVYSTALASLKATCSLFRSQLTRLPKPNVKFLKAWTVARLVHCRIVSI